MSANFNKPETKYIGYHISSDLPWMHHWLGLDWYQKCLIDVEGAEQTLDENAELGLERLALKYTTFGRYDIDLERWKSENKKMVDDDKGYSLIPDSIIIPYSLRDVDAPLRAAPQIIKRLVLDGTWDYYANYQHHLVTDIFTLFALQGLPIKKAKIDTLRELYTYCRTLLEAKFKNEVQEEGRALLFRAMMALASDGMFAQVYQDILKLAAEGKHEEAMSRATAFCLPDWRVETAGDTFLQAKWGAEWEARKKAIIPKLEHYLNSPNFKIGSSDHKARWLFDVKGLEPVKSTQQKEKGLPSIPWKTVMNMKDAATRALYHPAVDKQTIKLLADDTGDPLLLRMLDILAVGNIAKNCFKPAEIDPDSGELIKENGLHYWIASDMRLHNNYSVTETGRPRSWKPNILNLASYVHEGVARGMAEVLKEEHTKGTLPPQFELFLDPKKIPSVRSIVDVTDLAPWPGSIGWCIVESDYSTAEIRALAFLSGDANLIRIMTEPDDQFGFALVDGKKHVIRLKYATDCGIPTCNQSDEFILASATKNKVQARVKASDLLRDPNGNLVHPPFDIHWSLVEWVFEMPRERFDAKIQRTGVGKIGNTSDETPHLLIFARNAAAPFSPARAAS